MLGGNIDGKKLTQTREAMTIIDIIMARYVSFPMAIISNVFIAAEFKIFYRFY
ncbi:Hypothetical Protein SiL_0409 [Sulfolobus islandicus LAL14/1]|uniref:Uncharacterized protein n=1 Tax=Saccharolobus islandicus LAL14/1 TaxID=1241935 RepID=M9U724_SACIS|nr:Hypothetical Protein SiL_0409 [Sulfolobus islandicus LAL14/1]